MALSDLQIAKEYRNLQCNVIHDFYIPILKETVMYKRAVGFFNSAALYEMAIGLDQLVQNGGKIQLIVSPQLTEEDIKAIQEGYKLRKEIIAQAILREIEEPRTLLERQKLNLLANLIAENVLDIKVAFKIDANSAGIFHEKIGLVQDIHGNKVAFTGSMNETYSGLLLNYESIDVYCSWRPEDTERVEIKETAFDKLWNNLEEAMEIIDFPDVAVERLNQYKAEATKEIMPSIKAESFEENGSFFRIPKTVKLHKYQEDAITAWVNNGCRGIFDMATGTGKTYTGLGALAALSKRLKDKLAVVIVCPYQHLVEQWVEDIKAFGVKPLICYSRYDWKRKFKDYVDDYNDKIVDSFCAITTNATFATEYMQRQIARLKGDLCLVVDEAHNFGAKKQIACMSEIFNFRLALSATLERHHDEYGTQRLKDYFGDKCIEYTLEQAIREDKLTPYYYYPVVVPLEEVELDKYVELTDKIVQILRRVPKGEDLPKSAEMLLIERARLIAGAKGKLNALRETIAPYKGEKNLLVYCGATRVASDDDDDQVEDSDKRQIDEVSSILGNELGMVATQFTAAEDSKQRELIKEEFSTGKIQALVAIKCLDEGMNIPGIKTAFLLASSTNPKEYVQRRGRVLRKADGKLFAKIYDFICVPRPLDERALRETVQAELSLVKRELERMREFQLLSENPHEVKDLIRELTEKYNLYDLGEDYDRF